MTYLSVLTTNDTDENKQKSPKTVLLFWDQSNEQGNFEVMSSVATSDVRANAKWTPLTEVSTTICKQVRDKLVLTWAHN